MLKVLFQFTVFALSLGQLTSLQKQSGFNIYIFDLMVALFTFIIFIYLLQAKKSYKIPRNSIFFILFSFAALVSFVLNFYQYSSTASVQALFYLGRFLVYLLAAVSVYNLIEKNMLKPQEMFNTFIYSGVLISILGFIQLILLPDFGILDPLLGWDPHKNRLASTFFDPNFTGAYLVICLTLLIDKILQQQ